MPYATGTVREKRKQVMMNKKGITLSEILAILAVIGLIATIVITTIIKAG